MRYDKIDIPDIQLKDFMEALGEKPVESFNNLKRYYSPYRDDPEPMFVVNTSTNMWYDHATDQGGDIFDLAALKMNPKLYMDPRDFIIKYMNEYEKGKEMAEGIRQESKLPSAQLDINKIRLSDFMKALGQGHPIAADGNLSIYKAPYSEDKEPTLVINTESNLWRDTKSGAYGGIYDLAYEMTGSCNISELKGYIIDKMCDLYMKEDENKFGNVKKVEQSRQEMEKPHKRRMHL
jgi:hypothetical protein